MIGRKWQVSGTKAGYLLFLCSVFEVYTKIRTLSEVWVKRDSDLKFWNENQAWNSSAGSMENFCSSRAHLSREFRENPGFTGQIFPIQKKWYLRPRFLWFPGSGLAVFFSGYFCYSYSRILAWILGYGGSGYDFFLHRPRWSLIHRGTHHIGGVATEIHTAPTRILIDMGNELSLDEKDILTPLSIPGVTDTNGHCDAVLFTHNHGDHVGQLRNILYGTVIVQKREVDYRNFWIVEDIGSHYIPVVMFLKKISR